MKRAEQAFLQESEEEEEVQVPNPKEIGEAVENLGSTHVPRSVHGAGSQRNEQPP